jgi:addiction module HigA family antidote
MSRMYNPPHPGETLREDVLPALGLSVSAAAGQLGVTRGMLSRVLNGNAPISADLAVRLEKWLGVDRGGDAEKWMRMQASYDLWRAHSRSGSLDVARAPGSKVIPNDVVQHALISGVSPARAWREYLGLTEAQVAVRLGVSQRVYAQWEASTRIREATREKIAGALSITVEHLNF